MKIRMLEQVFLKQFLSTDSNLAFTNPYNVYTPALYHLAMLLTGGNKLIAEQLVVETWAVSISHIKNGEPLPRLKNLLSKKLVLCSSRYYHSHGSYMLINECTGSTQHVNVTEEDKTKTRDILSALNSLPVGYRHVFVLHDIKGIDHTAISELLNITEGLCRSLLFNARQHLERTCSRGNSRKKDWKRYADQNSFREISEQLRRKVVSTLVEQGLMLPSRQKKTPESAFLLNAFYILGRRWTI